MGLYIQINEDWKQSIKNKDIEKKKVLTFVRSKLLDKAKILKSTELSDDNTISVLRKMAKDQKDFVDKYGGDEAINELSLINSYLPKLMSEEEILKNVEAILATFEEPLSMNDIGKVMSVTMKALKGKVDGSIVRKIIQKALSQRK